MDHPVNLQKPTRRLDTIQHSSGSRGSRGSLHKHIAFVYDSVVPPVISLLTKLAASSRTTKRKYSWIVEQLWVFSVVSYSLLRLAVAWGTFSEHGANIWIFGLIDVGTAWPYAKSIAAVCKRSANREWSRLPLPTAAALATFFAPYAYLWFAAGEMPGGVRIGMSVWVSVLLVSAGVGMLYKTRKLRSENGSSLTV